MKSTIGIQLVRLDRNGEMRDLFSRGAVVEVYGVECCYMGPTPDGLAWFWIGPGDVRPLDSEQLRFNNFVLTDALNGKQKGK